MQTKLKNYLKIAGITFLVLGPAFITGVSLNLFETKAQEIQTKLANESEGTVAGASETKINDLSEDLRIFVHPYSQVSSFTSSNDLVQLTLETNRDLDELYSYYEDLLLLSDWEIQDGIYVKGSQKLKVEISEGIIKIELQR